MVRLVSPALIQLRWYEELIISDTSCTHLRVLQYMLEVVITHEAYTCFGCISNYQRRASRVQTAYPLLLYRILEDSDGTFALPGLQHESVNARRSQRPIIAGSH